MAKPSWISVSPTSGQNNGSIQVTAAENTNIDNRSGVVEVTGGGITKSIDVSQTGGFYLKEVAIMSTTKPPCSVKSTGQVQELNAENDYRITMTETFGITIDMNYPGLSTGPVVFRMIFSKNLTPKKLSMASGKPLPTQITCEINQTDPTQLIFKLANGYPKIPDGDKVIIQVSGPSAEDFIIYYVNAAI